MPGITSDAGHSSEQDRRGSCFHGADLLAGKTPEAGLIIANSDEPFRRTEKASLKGWRPNRALYHEEAATHRRGAGAGGARI